MRKIFKLIKKIMATMIINNNSHIGKSITIIDGKVMIDGKNVTPENTKEITITVNGNVEDLSVDYCSKVSISGDVGSVKTMSADVDIKGHNIGSVSSQSGDVKIGLQVEGDVKTMSGDVTCGNIAGKVSTMSGDIKHK